MAHFADGKWNPSTGLVAAASGAPSLAATVVGGVVTVNATGVETGTPAPFTNSATPVTLVTFSVPRAGMYCIMGYLKVTAAGTGAGQICSMTIAYNDGFAQAASPLVGQRGGLGANPNTSQSSVDALTLNAVLQVSGNIFCAAGSTITLALLGAGTISPGATIQSYWAIELV